MTTTTELQANDKDNFNANAVPHLSVLSTVQPMVINAQLAKSYSECFRISDGEVREMIQWFLDRKKWTIGFLAGVLDLAANRLGGILSGNIDPTHSERRLIWLFWCLDTQPKCLHLPAFFITWGKVDYIREEKLGPNYPGMRPEKEYFNPLALWMNIDWSFRDSQIGRQFRIPWKEVQKARRFIRSFPFQHLQEHWRRCGKDPTWVAALKRQDLWWEKEKPKLAVRRSKARSPDLASSPAPADG